MNEFTKNRVRGFLLDVTGVLYNGSEDGCGTVIPGSVEAVERLYRESMVRFVTNESTLGREGLAAKLSNLGFRIDPSHLIIPLDVAKYYLRKNNLRPHLLVHRNLRNHLDDIDQNSPNCVLVGYARDDFTYEAMNSAFQILMSLKEPLIVSLGCGKFYRRAEGFNLDVGSFVKALQYATDAEVVIIGKPTKSFFMSAVEDMKLQTDEVVMIGDDIVTDIGGAQNAGIKGVQVQTGKWRSEWMDHKIKPDLIANNLKEAVDIILLNNSS
ncbi:unnamed protein product [Dracunculus medinensis]|uniref:Phospholysine phosphohistidine inorganic pyrophosphate phosphatase n=1 Tax=Dracunculus medinensis TaxID=318479 RepID=A0A0N4U6D5_DRAME|nr:unnamed protein product [Dracunculus medinensis]